MAARLQIGLQAYALPNLVVESAVDHEGAAALLDGHDAFSLEVLERLAYGVAVHTELIRKRHHGWDLIVRRVGPLVDGFLNRVGDFPPSRAGHVAVRKRVGHSAILRW